MVIFFRLVAARSRKPPVQFLGSRALRFVSITEAATAASSGVISPSAICEMMADMAVVTSAGVSITGSANALLAMVELSSNHAAC